MKYLKIIDASSGEILIDFKNIDVTPSDLEKGIIAHDKSGKQIIGTGPIKSTKTSYIDDDGYFVIPKENIDEEILKEVIDV